MKVIKVSSIYEVRFLFYTGLTGGAGDQFARGNSLHMILLDFSHCFPTICFTAAVPSLVFIGCLFSRSSVSSAFVPNALPLRLP